MARDRPIDRATRINQYRDEMLGYVGGGMSYERARRAFWANHGPNSAEPLDKRSQPLLDEAEQEARSTRRAIGAQRATETKRQQRRDQAQAAREEQERQAAGHPVETVLYDPLRAFGVPDSRVSITFTDPQTGAGRTTVVYLPLYAGLRVEGMASRVAAVIAMSEQNEDYNHVRDLYDAILLAFQAGAYSINQATPLPR